MDALHQRRRLQSGLGTVLIQQILLTIMQLNTAFCRKRYGMRCKNRNDSSERFWSSSVLATDGKAKGHTYNYQGGVGDEFYRVSNWGSDNYRDWLLSEFWINLATEDSSKAGNANTKVYIYDLRFYYDSQGGNNQLVIPAFRPWADRNKAMFG